MTEKDGETCESGTPWTESKRGVYTESIVRRVDSWEALHVSMGVFNPIQDHRPIGEMQLPSAVVQHTRRAAACTRSFYLGIEMRHGDLSGFANLPGWGPGFANTEMEALSCHWRYNFGRDSCIVGACNLIRLCATVLCEAVSLQMLRAATGRSSAHLHPRRPAIPRSAFKHPDRWRWDGTTPRH
jgi:hypothetical protein